MRHLSSISPYGVGDAYRRPAEFNVPSKPTMQDVAERAGVSRSLVSLVFQDADNVSERRRSAVLTAAEQLGYRPNRLARNLAQGRSLTIGAVVDDMQNPYFTSVLEHLEHGVADAGYQIMLANGGRDAERTLRAAETFAELQVDALVLAGPRGPDELILHIGERIPTVLLARSIDSDAIDSVQVDEHLGGELVVEHLHKLGHGTIVHVDGGDGASAAARRSGYQTAMSTFGLERAIDVVAGDFTHAAGIAAAIELSSRAEMPTAVFAGNDLIAAGFWMQLERLGRAVPHDVSLIGFDDSSMPGLGGVGLTTVRQPVQQMGRRAAQLLIDRIGNTSTGGRHEAIPPSLVERSSTAPLVN